MQYKNSGCLIESVGGSQQPPESERLVSVAKLSVPLAPCEGRQCRITNGMDSSSPKQHLGARLEVLLTSHEREGVHYEQA